MEKLFHRVDRLRIIRNILYFSAFAFCFIVMIFNHYFIKKEWLYALIIFDDLLILVVIYFLIETKVGNEYNHIYYGEFLPLVLKSINPNYDYEKNPREFLGNFMDAKVFDYDSKIRINHVVSINESLSNYLIYDAQIYISTYRSIKIMQFKGMIILLSSINKAIHNGLILYNKNPHLGRYRLVKELNFGKYRIFENIERNLDLLMYDKLKTFILKYPNLKLNISLNHNVMIFLPKYRRFFRKPLFKKIDSSFFEAKKQEFQKIKQMIEEFINCF